MARCTRADFTDESTARPVKLHIAPLQLGVKHVTDDLTKPLHVEGKLGHQHANSGWGTFDDDNMVGAAFFMQTLELALTLQDVNYGSQGERIGYDLYPYTEDQVAAVRRSVLQWAFIDDLARKLDRSALSQARANADAVEGYRIVYEAMGLDKAYTDRIISERKR